MKRLTPNGLVEVNPTNAAQDIAEILAYMYIPCLQDTAITPGPWFYFDDPDSPFWGEIRSTVNFSLIAQQPDGDDREADFKAMAMVPELIEALEWGVLTHDGSEWAKKAEGILKKVKGQTT